ncbi:MAG: four-carbon acid sugar kinase family protein [Verrucomicrobia bacterium]|nr:four-carbon acid sugar kinase family protein [Verrucomicrobiota bacterium]
MNHELLLSYYGDDFTGSTDVMEALSKVGLRTVLFLAPPSREQLARFPDLRAFGIAGGSRTMSPEEMERALPPAFQALKASGAPIIHYKMCSTFDSSPCIGSIGRAIEIGRRVFGDRPTPLMVGAPVLGRYVVFGNLFARSGLDTEPFRLDRHPTMSRHPVTPMKEGDLRLILAEQTKLPVELVDVLKLESNSGATFRVADGKSAPIVLFDTLREEHLPVIGRMIEGMAKGGPLFTVGSSGVEYALTAHWNGRFSSEGAKTQRVEQDEASASATTLCSRQPSPQAVKQIVCVSGSCSPVTDRQIAHVLLQPGFVEVALDPDAAADSDQAHFVIDAAAKQLDAGHSVILHTSRGLDDPRRRGAAADAQTSSRLGDLLTQVLERLLQRTGLRRAVVCGGDTSMHVARALGSEALEYLGPMAPGSPLCRVHAPGRVADGCEIVFKGGQVGRDHFFHDVLQGGPRPT